MNHFIDVDVRFASLDFLINGLVGVKNGVIDVVQDYGGYGEGSGGGGSGGPVVSILALVRALSFP